MSRKKETITLSIPSGTKEQLEGIARKLGIFWGKSPSVSGLLVAIAQQEFEVGEPFTLNSPQVAALQQAIGLLKDSGFIEQAQIISSLLLERGKLEPPMRQSLLQQVSQPTEAWRLLADQFCKNQQPFHLLYANPQVGDLSFTVRYAEIAFEEKRFYLNIWCDETEDIANTDFPELIHNRCLRLDRIKVVVPINGQWRQEGLDSLKVYLHFYKGLIKAYEAKPNDISNEVMGEVRQVVRNVSNPFWLIREVLRYGDECVIVSPENVRSLLQQKILTLCQLYDIETRE
ncbi:WYL domain-containing protein [Cylindrospermum sp. FACHB-282]|uniref:WYL domain-containing protein n=1 Tax=Cylindrospermum sp. FACHB-282 TaxID=2692794 RepID=UPI0016835E60|nr:WYL domain-containing protein [Cylindrospermum sp. FACHB-282]MBD2384622.1 WYL domain-containing protein [Cylindrospermum sp. FACHB-282]